MYLIAGHLVSSIRVDQFSTKNKLSIVSLLKILIYKPLYLFECREKCTAYMSKLYRWKLTKHYSNLLGGKNIQHNTEIILFEDRTIGFYYLINIRSINV